MQPTAVERSAQVDEAGTVESEGLDRGPALNREADDPREVVAPDEMVAPSIAPRMEKSGHFRRHGIDRLDFRVLVIVTTLAGKGQIIQVAASSGLERYDVLD